ncbi:hypothetical protein [Actinoplanes sp. NPDC049599]|uniref:hypothetical protein n=1 Tax=Actinoplanes sp. NPDC049599 TaxID=3363903 RepID=UPI0037A3AAC5
MAAPAGHLCWRRRPDGDEVERSAHRAVTVLVRALNDLLDPAVDQLATDIPADSPTIDAKGTLTVSGRPGFRAGLPPGR